jgi:circadian clock protein KaiC
MNDEDPRLAALERVPSGIPGLDAILQGGLYRGGVYMVLGRPGAGKTILGNQICFRHVAAGGRAIFLTLLTESHARLIAQLRSMAFFRAEQVGDTLSYVSGYESLEKEKLKGLLGVIRKIVRDHKATLLVIDGIVTAGSLAESELEMKKFIHELQVLVELVGCTTLLLTGANRADDQYPQRTMVDGLVQLSFDPVGMGMARTIEVAKFRGGPVLLGRHLFDITNAGITVFPRIEALLGRDATRPDDAGPPRAFGITALDAMLDGGLERSSITMLLGSPGSGKTVLGLNFLAAGARLKAPGLYLGFFETEDQLRRKADAVGSDFSQHLREGLIEIMWQPPLELIADALAERLLNALRDRGARLLFIDGLGPLRDAVIYPERTAPFLVALCNELRTRGVTTILSDETRDLFGPELELPVSGLGAMLDNVIVLRHVELRARLHRFVSVLKTRTGPSDPTLREFTIGKSGIDVSSTFESAEAILSGLARVVAAPATSRTRGRSRAPSKRRRK